VSVIRYRYSGEPMKLEDRFVNPLGFQVLRYRKDPESAPVADLTVVPGPTTVAVPGGPGTLPVVVAPGPATTTVTTTTTAPGSATLGRTTAEAARAAIERRNPQLRPGPRRPEPEL
jgi:hypothetical protein